jgi:putative transposase
MVRPAALRLAVDELWAKFAMKKRRACRVVGLAPSTLYYRARRPEPVELVAKLRAHAAKRPRWGYRRLHVLLQREGHVVNHKRVFRLYTAEGLAVRRKRRKRIAAAVRTLLPPPSQANQRWSMDFMEDSLASGRRFRILNVVDDFTRECLASTKSGEPWGRRRQLWNSRPAGPSAESRVQVAGPQACVQQSSRPVFTGVLRKHRAALAFS